MAALALSPDYAVDHTVYAGLRGQGVYRTVDGGRSWHGVSPGGWAVIDTAAPVESDGSLQLSTDGGRTWRDVSGCLEQVRSLAFSPDFTADRAVFAAAGTLGQHGYAGGGIYRSTDGGQNWEEVLGGQPCLALALHPHLAITPTVWASLSGLVTALAVSPLLGRDRQIPTLAFGASRTLYAGVQEEGPTLPGAIYRSTDGGDTWQRLEAGIPGTWQGAPCTISALAFAHDGSVLAGVYCGSGEGSGAVYRSVDGGDSWQPVGSGLDARVFALAARPGRSLACGLTAYAGTDGGLWQLDLPQGGPAEPGTWTSAGPRGGRAQALAVSPDFANDGLALAGEWSQERGGGESGLGIFRSVDGGQTWVPSSSGSESDALIRGVTYGSAIHAFAFSPNFASDRLVFAASGGGLFKSTDGGERWSWVGRLYDGPSGTITAVAVAPDFAESGQVMAASGWGGLHVSRDGGIHWTAYMTVPASSAVAYSPAFASDGVAFAGGWGL